MREDKKRSLKDEEVGACGGDEGEQQACQGNGGEERTELESSSLWKEADLSPHPQRPKYSLFLMFQPRTFADVHKDKSDLWLK